MLAVIIIMTVVSCKKEATELSADKVMVRIENHTGQTITNPQIAGVSFPDINNEETSEYQAMTRPITAIVCDFEVSGNPVIAGVIVCGASIIYMEPGYYTMKLMSPDSSRQYPYTVTRE